MVKQYQLVKQALNNYNIQNNLRIHLSLRTIEIEIWNPQKLTTVVLRNDKIMKLFRLTNMVWEPTGAHRIAHYDHRLKTLIRILELFLTPSAEIETMWRFSSVYLREFFNIFWLILCFVNKCLFKNLLILNSFWQ